ncbi:DUF4097 family beta strand repeat-containing protein [Paenibacillus hexagrammi]|uniref:DUF4097 domain-containing protein n=1 Tax=Paenibacillus hexagrammi TaxID=2908839 RepID=A0ABY3SH43_9BACL|nr:DUF4097 family beta strand repeat-containing protein [Paenibacillus sp. YPD9-1]UJF33182.1 DUF4097 domain-containing protein [Paenibacillus sp. YPD9-1]
MKKSYKFWMVLGFLCLAVGLVGTAISFKETDFDSGITQIDVEKSMDAAQIENLSISTDFIGMTFIPSDGKDITVHLVGTVSKTLAKDCTIDAVTEGSDTWTVNVCNNPRNNFQFGFDLNELKNLIAHHDTRLRTEVTLPNKLYKSISVSSDVGSLQLKDIKSESLHAVTDTGSIALDRFEGSKLHLESDTGRITVGDAQGNVTIKTDTGSIQAKLRELGEQVEMDADTGSIDLQLTAKPTSAFFDLSSDVGRVNLDVPGATANRDGRNALTGTIGDGHSKVRLRTDTGSITVMGK